MIVKKIHIEQLIAERINASEDTFILPSGVIVPFGSDEHIEFLENSLDSLMRIRDIQPRASRRGTWAAASRKIYSDAVNQLRREVRILRHFIKETIDNV